MTSTDVDTQEVAFAISGPAILGPNGYIDTEDMNLPPNDLISIIEWILSQDVGPNKIPVVLCKSEEVYAVDQKRLRDVMKKYDSRQLKHISSKEVEKEKRKMSEEEMEKLTRDYYDR
jgi:hypothetical protein